MQAPRGALLGRMRENKDVRSAGKSLWPPAWPEITLGELRGHAEVRGGTSAALPRQLPAMLIALAAALRTFHRLLLPSHSSDLLLTFEGASKPSYVSGALAAASFLTV